MSLGPVMVGLAGMALAQEERDMLLHPLVGGVILFTRNFESVEQLEALTTEIHRLREPPLLIAVDHEGGRVQRFRNGFTLLPAVRQLGRIYQQDKPRARELAELSGWLMAIELRSVGVDFSFAPVLDLDRGISEVIGDRAFHSKPETVADLAHEYMRGMHRAGMAATGKHFPGHGSVVEDSHHSVIIDKRRLADIQIEDMLPFERMIHYGVEALMMAHIMFPEVDDRLTGYSTIWQQDILRRQLEFQGVIFSDDLEMAGAGVIGDIAERAHTALETGGDMVLVCKEFTAMGKVIDGLKGWSNPVSQLRLARMHGRNRITRAQLAQDPAWQEAINTVEGYDEPHTLDLM